MPVVTVPLSIGTRSSSTVTINSQETTTISGHSYAYKVTLASASTGTSVGDKLVTGANSYVITAATGTTLTVVGDPFSTTAAPSTGSATTQRSYSTINAWSAAAPSLTSKDWIWQGVLFKEGSGTNNEWVLTSTPSFTGASDATRYFWLTAAPGQSFRDTLSQSSGKAFSLYNNANGVSIFMNGNYIFLFDFYSYIKFSGLQIYKIASGQFITTGNVTYDSCIVKAISAPLHGYSIVKNSLFEISSDSAVYDGYAGSLSEPSIDPSSQLINCTFVSTNRKGYAITMPGYGGNSMIVKNCAFFGFNTITNNVSIIKQADSTNNATDLSTFGWTANNITSLNTSSQFNNAATGAEDFRIREYSSLINNAVRAQQYTGDVDIIGRARSTAASTIGAWSWEASPSYNRLATGIQSRNQYGAVVDMGSYYVSKDYGLDVYPNLVPGRTSPGLYAWGGDSYGQLGVGNTVYYSSPVQVGSLTNWKSVWAGHNFSLSISNDDKLWSWGNNTYGQLGLSDTTNRSSPVQIGTDNKWKYVSSGFRSSFAIKTDGTLWSWGYNYFGGLGLGDTTDRSAPVQVGSATNWKYIASNYNGVGIKTNGELWAWGYSSGALTGADGYTPTQVGLLTDWKQLACGYAHTVAVKTNGTLWGWGNNTYGSIGLGNTVIYASPVQIGSLNNWKYVAAGGYRTLAIKTDGTLWSWGQNTYGTLGIGNTVNYSSPVQIGSLTNWKTISGGSKTFGDTFVCATKTDGTLWVWGRNAGGQLGQSNLISYSSPVQVGSLNSWKSASAGNDHLIAISDGYI